MKRRAPLFVVALFAAVSSAVAAGDVCRPATGDDRVAMLDALRAPVAAVLRMKIAFVGERIRICGDWAFVLATPALPGGGTPQWEGTACGGDTSHLAGGLIHREDGHWRLLEYALCPSDVAWADWPERYGAPPGLFDE